MLKQCQKCLEYKSLNSFSKQERITKNDYHDKICKDCRNLNAKNNNNKAKDFINSLRLPCVKCGENRKHLIDFHHLDPNKKDINISKYAISGATKFETKQIKILEEISKCVTLCSNCHRDFHYLEKNQNINFQYTIPYDMRDMLGNLIWALDVLFF